KSVDPGTYGMSFFGSRIVAGHFIAVAGRPDDVRVRWIGIGEAGFATAQTILPAVGPRSGRLSARGLRAAATSGSYCSTGGRCGRRAVRTGFGIRRTISAHAGIARSGTVFS